MRSAPRIRSSEAPITPTASCACRLARLMRGTITPRITPGAQDHGQGDAQQHRIHQAHHHHRRDEREPAGAQADQRVGGDLAQQGGVGGDAGHQVPGLAAVHGRDRAAAADTTTGRAARRAPPTRRCAAARTNPARPSAALATTSADIASSAPVMARSCARSSISSRRHQRQQQPGGARDQREHGTREQGPAVRAYVAAGAAARGAGRFRSLRCSRGSFGVGRSVQATARASYGARLFDGGRTRDHASEVADPCPLPISRA